jgi:hypothetical protein
MIYRESLVMRKALLWFFAATIALNVLWLFTPSPRENHAALGSVIGGFVLFALIAFAAIYGVALGNASREPARVLWTLPRPRWRNALDIVEMDLLAMVVLALGVVAIGYVAIVTRFGPAHLFAWLSTVNGLDVSLTFGMAFGIYGWSALFGVLFRRIPYAGLIALPVLAVGQQAAALPGILGSAMRWILVADPITLKTWASISRLPAGTVGRVELTAVPLYEHLHGFQPVDCVYALFAVSIGTCALAIFMWQRAEVLA